MRSAVSSSAHQGKLVRLVHAATDAKPFIAANLRQLRWLVGWISDVERQLPGAYSGNSGGPLPLQSNPIYQLIANSRHPADFYRPSRQNLLCC